MASQTDALRALLEADGTLVAILTGGIHDASELDRTGKTVANASYDTDGVTLLPTAVIRWRGGIQQTNSHFTAERRTFELYFYADTGFAAIDAAKRRCKDVLHRKRITSDNEGVNWINYVADIIEEDFSLDMNAPMAVSRYELIYTRK